VKTYGKFLRLDHLPTVMCPGCGCGVVLKATLRALDKLGLRNDDVVMVSGIGCSSRIPGYVDFHTLHTTHGRAVAFATGVKLAKPNLTVIVMTGDGDCAAIGGNHFIHAARRNIDLTVIVHTNLIYGMTGGQVSPATPLGARATTSPHGNIEPPFDIAGLAVSAGAPFVARCSVYHAALLERLVEKAIARRGFSVVETFPPCPTAYGRMNKLGGAVDMFRWQKENSVPISKAAEMTPEELEGKLVIGVLADHERREYTERYHELHDNLKEPAQP
jgi:2-oxoglutarate ferredoxin oxidoreductase subunit beta